MFLLVATLMTTAPSLIQDGSILYFSLGTPKITMSASLTAVSTLVLSSGKTSFPRMKIYTESMSTLQTFAPSFASIAATGLPTTSDLFTTTAVLPVMRSPTGRAGS
eukprot:Skav228806  [mRNA]  locus=scaffold359:143956:148406:- [translate_table: standard]